ncbi:ROK family transcriptional regulator [Amycolatopsis sp. CA-126428]|uniref:ROK family transcriptional regulator n=1 Tax=Amycolatopsis sp. CA-126428 TaxID=2073158 RepID=UPI000CD0977A|nr:ROK family transcriptional regulator [Amycolatopsis sp. CA-126428]
MTQAVRHEEMRARNLEVVLGAVSRGGPLTRAALAEVTGLTKSTVSKLVGDLVEAGLLAETGPARAGERGRPGVDVVLSGARMASLGLEINVDYLAVRVLDLTGEVRFAARRERDNRGSRPKKVLGELQDLATDALAEAHRLGLEAAGAVLAVSGPVGDGVLFSAPNLGWQDVRPAELLRLPVPVELDNEANLAALGELWYGDGERDFLYVSGEIGIGAGLVVNGVLYSGATGLAGELGHVVVAPEGAPCRCGGSGCLETYAGQEALLTAGNAASVPALLSALERGDETALAACAAAGRALGIALTSAVNLLDLDRIVLGGVFTQLYPWLSGPVSEVLTTRLGGLRGAPPVLSASRLGGDAATLGAAGRVIHRVLADPASFVTRAS